MLMVDLIGKKRDGKALTKEEIDYVIKGYVDGTIPDYQMSAMLMAIVLQGMNDEETLNLTISMLNSGDKFDLSGIDGLIADKHSTGGVGDKTSIVVCPIVASLGLKIAKMSGRGLGHTGGTLDKLESIKGYNTGLSEEQFIENVNKIGIAITGQTKDIDPADKKIYALRDVTGTVSSVPLIVSSIMSKKLASGADIIVLDVKCGDGAFMKTIEDATYLASKMVTIGKGAGKRTAAVITDMDQPLGTNIGNALEVKEAVETLTGKREGDFLEVCLALGAAMLRLADIADTDELAKEMMLESIRNGKAFEKLVAMVEAQGGNSEQIKNLNLLPEAPVKLEVYAPRDGYIKRIYAEKMGLVSLKLGGGRRTKEDVVDPSVGIVIEKNVADYVKKGDLLATIHAATEESAQSARDELYECYEYSDEDFVKPYIVKGVIM